MLQPLARLGRGNENAVFEIYRRFARFVLRISRHKAHFAADAHPMPRRMHPHATLAHGARLWDHSQVASVAVNPFSTIATHVVPGLILQRVRIGLRAKTQKLL